MMKTPQEKTDAVILQCEKKWVYAVLMAVAGYLGAFTYALRGGIFCNAQTANVVLLAMAMGDGAWRKAAYYLIPISAYLLGAIVSEALPKPVKGLHLLRWDTILIGIEAAVIFLLGLLPESAPFQISQIAINFICSMQYNTFRQAEGVPMVTTFCTNHIRQTGIYLLRWTRHRESSANRSRCLTHVAMLGSFVAGGTVSTVLCRIFLGRAIWFALIPLLCVFVALARADLGKEKELMHVKPRGH